MAPLCQGDHLDRSYSRLESWAPRSSGQALSTEQPCLRIPSGLNSGLITKPAPVAVTADSWGDRRVRPTSHDREPIARDAGRGYPLARPEERAPVASVG